MPNEEMLPLDPHQTAENNSSGTVDAQQQKRNAIIRDNDGKIHRLILDSSFIEITLLNRKSQPTRHSTKIPFEYILCVRSNRVSLRCGVPKRSPEICSDEPLIETPQNYCCLCTNRPAPNVLYFYYAYRSNVYAWRLREAAIHFTTTVEKKEWQQLLSNTIEGKNHRPKQLLVFINPFGGKGKANGIWTKEVEPFFKLASINYEVIRTERADHALDFVKELAHQRWLELDGIISVGGDGLFNEVLSATVIRTQVEHGKDYHDEWIDAFITPRVRFGIIGAGSANSIVSSVFGINDCPTAALHIAIGSKCTIDVCAVYQDGKLSKFSADAISYGWLGDVLHHSEQYRCLGPIRYQYSALRTSIKHPTYFGRVSFALSHAHPLAPLGNEVDNAEDKGPDPSNPLNIPSCTGPCGICSGQIPMDPHYPYHWQSDFTHVICCVIPCVSPFTPYGLAPYTGLNDGTMDLCFIPMVSRFKNLQIMRKVAMYGSRFIRSEYPDVKVFRVSRWKFSPKNVVIHSENAANGESNQQQEEEASGAWNLDGEILPQPPNKSLHFRLHPQLINYYGRDGVDLDDPRYSRCCSCIQCGEHKISQLVIEAPSS